MTAPTQVSHAGDLALVRSVLAGDRAAADRLADRLVCISRILKARASFLCGGLPEHDLLDLSQEVAIKVLARLADYGGRAAIESWVFAFCEGELRNALRRRYRRKGDVGNIDVDDLTAEASEVEDFADLHRCLDLLAVSERQMMRDKHYEGMRLEDIAARSATNLNTIKSRYCRALTQLRHCLGRAHHEEQR